VREVEPFFHGEIYMSDSRRVGLYCRVSTVEQNCQNQEHDLRQYAAQRGWTVTDVFTDHGFSGAKQARPALDKLMGDARRRKIDVVLVWRFDRFARSTSHLLAALEEFRQLGIDFCSLNEAVDTSTPMGRMIFTVCSAVAELERGIIVERVRCGIARAKREGKTLGRPKSDVNQDEVKRLRLEGQSLRQIGKQLGISRTTVHDILKSA
jgi:DNA invertase Pin-like site-specific DNA recombinase